MLRACVAAALGCFALAGAAGPAAADEPRPYTVDIPPEATQLAGTDLSPFIYFNRCVGGCTIHGVAYGGINDARTQTSTIPCNGTVSAMTGSVLCVGGTPQDYTVAEFDYGNGNIGAAADADWAALMQCLREVYSPFNVTVTDQLPSGGQSFNEGIIAGFAANVGYGGFAIGLGGGPCAPQNNAISFSFANEIGPGARRVLAICSLAAQETAHAYGLEHVYQFIGGASACTDPMSYRSFCGQRFFRNENAQCGEYAVRTCDCGGAQNSHHTIETLFGKGTPITTPPHVSITSPADGAQVGGSTPAVAALSGAQRGIAKIELWLNGYNWLTAKGAPFETDGQPESTYTLTFPTTVPDGIIDIVVKAYDDIDVEADAAITVTKGAPCTSAATCLTGQKCDAGKCYWDPPTGEVGDTCAYPQFCISGECADTTAGMLCTKDCVVGVADSCPMGFECAGAAGGNGQCLPSGGGGGGCCSATPGGAIWLHGGTSALVLALLLRRRRRR